MNHLAQVLWGGVLIGLVFGVLGQRSRFCLIGGLRDWWQRADRRRSRAFALAIAVAVVATQGLAGAGVVDPGESIYLQSNLAWPAMLLGGVMFGYGMALANGCGARSLVLLGGGNLRPLPVLLMLAISAHMTLSGVLAPVRQWLVGIGSDEGWLRIDGALPALLGATGVAPELARWLAVTLVAGLAGLYAMRGAREAPALLAAGAAIGLLVAAAWLVTGYLGADDFEPVAVEALTFVAPLGDSVLYLMLASGMSAGFGVGVIGGVLAGAGLAAVAAREFSLQGFDSPSHMLRAMAGGYLMGAGGALALGCSIGQGLSGVSTLAMASFIAFAGIVVGARLGTRAVSAPQSLEVRFSSGEIADER